MTAKKSREHVFPRWLLRFLHRDPIPVVATRYAPDGTPLSTRSHPLDKFVLGGVCRGCNHGWMNDLEGQARPIIKACIDGSVSVRDLDRTQCTILARWGVKTAACVNLASDSDKFFVASLVSELKNPLNLPEGLHVFAAQHAPTEPSYWLQAGNVEFFLPHDVPPSLETRRELSGRGFRIGLQFGALCLFVVYWPLHNQWPLATWPDLHEPLWPPEIKYLQAEHRYDGETNPLAVNSHLFLYRGLETLAATSHVGGPFELATQKNRAPHVSGPEPPGTGGFLPVPDVITPEIDRYIRAWLSKSK
ncbi:MAG TPA: hypothetical protein VGO33_03955 [Gemmatimonadaceae bacterium]|jgi:hypothetical protein|nr:hypothetical protein [Gemmatimonadaceae bacterium]